MFHTSRRKCAINQQSSDTYYKVKEQNFQSPNDVETAVIDTMLLLKSSLSKLPGTLSLIAKLIFLIKH